MNQASNSNPNPSAPRRATLTDVARRAQVSYQTVSNVINAPERVKASTADKVRRAIDELGFTPNVSARQLRSGLSYNLGVRLAPVSEGVSGAILDEFLHALTEAAQGAGYRIVLFTAADDAAEIDMYRELHEQGQVDGFVLTSTHPGDARTRYLADRGIAFATFGRPWEDGVHTAWVDVDGSVGIAAAMDALVSAGHEKIGFIGWPEGSAVGDERQAAWAAAAQDATLLERCEDRVAEGAAACAALMARGATAVVCVSDTLALGAHTMRTDTLATDPASATSSPQGTVVEPVAAPVVVGFDDSVVARSLGFSSVSQPIGDVARCCLEAVLARVPQRANPTQNHTSHKTTPQTTTPQTATPPGAVLLPSAFVNRL